MYYLFRLCRVLVVGGGLDVVPVNEHLVVRHGVVRVLSVCLLASLSAGMPAARRHVLLLVLDTHIISKIKLI